MTLAISCVGKDVGRTKSGCRREQRLEQEKSQNGNNMKIRKNEERKIVEETESMANSLPPLAP